MSVQSVNLAVRKEIERVEALSAVERAHAIPRLQEALRHALRRLASARSAAYGELAHDFGWSDGDLASEFGHNRARSEQIRRGR